MLDLKKMSKKATGTWVIIPVKPLNRGKSRLSGVLSKEDRADLMLQFCEHVLKTVSETEQIDHCLVVTRDQDIAQLAEKYQATVFSRDPYNLNSAVNNAFNHVNVHDAGEILIIPADLPFLEVIDLQQILATDGEIVICPDNRLDGTNALLLRGIETFKFRYGTDSFQNHLIEAKNVGVIPEVVYASSVEFDVDTPTDLNRYHASLSQQVS